ncbi:MAG: hypothetical protein COV79_00785, partial [Parcubacteria group bacterium CG11_big_fil_rev_8_21_14_0_20_41_14]
ATTTKSFYVGTSNLVVKESGNVGIASSTPNWIFSVNDGVNGFAVNSSGSIIQGGHQGAVIEVSYGGTGAATLTDGGILLGSGTGAITPMDVLGDGVIVVGDNVTDPAIIQAFTSSTGTLRHEVGGLELDVSAITTGGLVRGASSGAFEILTLGTAGQILGSVGGQIGYISTSTFAHLSDNNVFTGTGNTTFAGTLGVATTTPWGRLSVEGQGTLPGFVVSDTDNNTDFIVDANGRIGIAKTNPTFQLDVTGNARFTSLVDASHFVATSTSATSTFNYIASGTGNLEIGGNTSADNVIINRYGGNLGIASSTPNWIFSVNNSPNGFAVNSSGNIVQGGYTANVIDEAYIDLTIARDSELPVGANPSGTVGLTAVNGSATTFLRSDGAPALSQAIVPTWTGTHTFSNAT